MVVGAFIIDARTTSIRPIIWSWSYLGLGMSKGRDRFFVDGVPNTLDFGLGVATVWSCWSEPEDDPRPSLGFGCAPERQKNQKNQKHDFCKLEHGFLGF